MPGPLAEMTDDIRSWQWWLILNDSALQTAQKGLDIVLRDRAMLRDHLGDVSGDIGAVESSQSFISRIREHSIEKTLMERMQAIEDDILGAYWVNDSKIQIYWMPLAIFSSLFGISLACPDHHHPVS